MTEDLPHSKRMCHPSCEHPIWGSHKPNLFHSSQSHAKVCVALVLKFRRNLVWAFLHANASTSSNHSKHSTPRHCHACSDHLCFSSYTRQGSVGPHLDPPGANPILNVTWALRYFAVKDTVLSASTITRLHNIILTVVYWCVSVYLAPVFRSPTVGISIQWSEVRKQWRNILFRWAALTYLWEV